MLEKLKRLEAVEVRVLGSLMEKQQTTPDSYPMTLNSLAIACNQKTNRDPVMSLREIDVLNSLRLLSLESLVERISGARTDRWGHRVDELLSFKRDWLAVLTVLFLRGAQTPGEIRGRTDRMYGFDSLQQVESVLRLLGEPETGVVVELPRQPGQKETRWVLAQFAAEAQTARSAPSRDVDSKPAVDRWMELEQRVEDLEREVARLRSLLEEGSSESHPTA